MDNQRNGPAAEDMKLDEELADVLTAMHPLSSRPLRNFAKPARTLLF